MGNSRSNSSIQDKTRSSGISKLDKVPKVLPYPKLLDIQSTPQIRGVFCYIIKHYGYDGLSVLIYRQPKDDQVIVLCGDWHGNPLDLSGPTEGLVGTAIEFIQDDMKKFLEMMQLVNIGQAQFFFAKDQHGLVLVDVQVALNKLVGPGMIRDIFGKAYRIQEVKKIEIIDDNALEYIERGSGSYSGDLILKPSSFKLTDDGSPLYVEVKR